MGKIIINVFGTIILLGVGCILFRIGINSNGFLGDVMYILFARGGLYFVVIISLIVLLDAYMQKNEYWWLWYLSTLILLPVALPLYLKNRSNL